jgi:hypothetical protein
MLVACRLAGLSALETYYARVRVGRVWLRGLWLASARLGRVMPQKAPCSPALSAGKALFGRPTLPPASAHPILQ